MWKNTYHIPSPMVSWGPKMSRWITICGSFFSIYFNCKKLQNWAFKWLLLCCCGWSKAYLTIWIHLSIIICTQYNRSLFGSRSATRWVKTISVEIHCFRCILIFFLYHKNLMSLMGNDMFIQFMFYPSISNISTYFSLFPRKYYACNIYEQCIQH